MRRIVVGVDGSSSSLAALRWATEEAHLRGAEVDVVHAWSCPVYGSTAALVAPYAPPAKDVVVAAQRTLDQACDAVDANGVVVNRILEEGPPGPRLVETARGASMLVVGSRGRGDVASLFLGSVSRHCAHHAPCTVVIVRSGA